MADAATMVNEGDTVYDPSGKPFIIKNGQPVPADQADQPISVGQDIQQGWKPWLAKGALDFMGTPGTMVDLAAKGAGFVGQHIPFTSQDTADTIGNVAGKVSQAVHPYTAEGLNEQAQREYDKGLKGAVNVGYQPQTSLGGFVRTGEEFLPAVGAAALTGGESLLPTLAKGATSAIGSEGAGQAADAIFGQDSTASNIARMTGALGGYGGFAGARKLVTPLETEPARLAQAESLRSAGVPVDTAQVTNSPRVRLWLGDPPPNQDTALTQALMGKAGMPIPPGNTETLAKLTGPRLTELSKEGQQLAKSPLTVDHQLWDDLEIANPNSPKNVLGNIPPRTGAADIKEAQDAYQDFVDNVVPRPKGGGPVTFPGEKYWEYRQRWNGSNNPVVRQMGRALDDAASRSSLPWNEWNKNWADAQGLNEAAQAPGASHVLNPSKVYQSIGKDTDVKNLARSGEEILKPIQPAQPMGIGSALTPVVGALLGSHAGPEGSVLGAILGESAKRLAGSTVGQIPGALARSAPGRTYLENQMWRSNPNNPFTNLDPKTAAQLLASPLAVQAQPLTRPDESQ